MKKISIIKQDGTRQDYKSLSLFCKEWGTSISVISNIIYNDDKRHIKNNPKLHNVTLVIEGKEYKLGEFQKKDYNRQITCDVCNMTHYVRDTKRHEKSRTHQIALGNNGDTFYTMCGCGSKIHNSSMRTHLKTKKHNKWLQEKQQD
jgi:hypothetical protein